MRPRRAAGCALAGLAFILVGCSLRSGSAGPTAPVETAPPAKLTATPEAAFPLSVSANRRYLVDRRNRPFLIVGDSPQALTVKLSVGEAASFLANRKAAGFNTVWVNLLCNDYTGGWPDGETYDGIRPFTREGNLATPNEAYFARVDSMIRVAARQGMAVLLDPIETGGWLKVLRSNGPSKAYAFGHYLGMRYRQFPNIIWMSGNDFQSWRRRSDDTLALAVARGIRAADPGHLQTVELDFHGRRSSSLDDPRWKSLISLDAVYTFTPTYAQILDEYRREDHLPVFVVEASYEGEHDFKGPRTLRRQEYWAMLSGAAGQLYGNYYTWQFLDDWKTHVNTIGSREMTYMVNLFSGRPWYELVPDIDHRVVVSGYGSYSETGKVQDTNYVATASTPDGRLVMAYVPEAQTIGVDMNKLASRVRAQWYDPTNGKYLRAAGAPLDNAGVHQFSTPGDNGHGDPDWVLVLTAT
jgi:hypothetical protein